MSLRNWSCRRNFVQAKQLCSLISRNVTGLQVHIPNDAKGTGRVETVPFYRHTISSPIFLKGLIF